MKLKTLGMLYLAESGMHRPKPLLLLAFLALQGATAKRQLAELFFPGSKDRADALATTLARLRQHGAPIVDQDRIISTSVSCDAVEFKRYMHGEGYSDALTLYSGTFAKGLDLDLSGELEEWLLSEREQLASLARQAHLAVAERALTSGDTATARYHGESAYLLEAAPSLEGPEITRFHRLLARTKSNLLAQLRKEGEELDISLPAVTDGTPHNLPSLLTGFLGRDMERLELANVLQEADGRLITIHGPGGVGKTRLALQVAADHLTSPLFGDGIFFVPLDGLVSPAQLLPTLAQTVGVATEVAVPDVWSIRQALGSRQLLLILDNFEHLMENAPLLPELLKTCPNLSLLVTSRERLNLKAEWVLTLEGLDFPRDASDPRRALLSDAVQLFTMRAKRAQLGFTLGQDDLSEVLRICKAVSGFPLGLELAAAWAKVYPLEALAAALEANAAALETPHQDIRERHRSVGAAFNYSWEQLDPSSRKLLRCLAVFQGGFDLNAAVEVAGATPEALALLGDKALLQIGRSRYTFHALLHQYLQRKLADDPAHEREIQARHGAYYSAVLSHLNTEASGGASPELLSFMELEESNLVAYLGWALSTQNYGQLASLAEPLLWHLPVQGRFKEGVDLCERVLASLPASEPTACIPRAAFLSSYSFIKLFAGSSEEAVAPAQEALELAQSGSQESDSDQAQRNLQVIRALDVLGQALTRLGDSGGAIEQLRRAEQIARRYGEPVRLLRVLTNLGIAYTTADSLNTALNLFEEGQALYRNGKVSKSMDVVSLCIGHGFSLMLDERYLEAMQTLDEGLLLTEELGSKGQQPILNGIRVIAELEHALQTRSADGLAQAETRCRAILPIAQARGEVQGQIFMLGVLARCELAKHHHREALARLAETYEVAWENKNFMGFFCILPYVLDAAFAVSNIELAGELAGFISASPHLGSWIKRRGERAVVGWASDEVTTKVFEAALEQGCALALPELAQKILNFTKHGQYRESS